MNEHFYTMSKRPLSVALDSHICEKKILDDLPKNGGRPVSLPPCCFITSCPMLAVDYSESAAGFAMLADYPRVAVTAHSGYACCAAALTRVCLLSRLGLLIRRYQW